MTQDNMLEGDDHLIYDLTETTTMTLEAVDRLIDYKLDTERKRIHQIISDMYNDESVGLQYGTKNRAIHLKGRKIALLELIAKAGLAK